MGYAPFWGGSTMGRVGAGGWVFRWLTDARACNVGRRGGMGLVCCYCYR